jgi:hypothetical protein
MAILRFLLLELETTRFLLLEFEENLLVMARFATVRAKICSGSVSVISTIVV